MMEVVDGKSQTKVTQSFCVYGKFAHFRKYLRAHGWDNVSCYASVTRELQMMTTARTGVSVDSVLCLCVHIVTLLTH